MIYVTESNPRMRGLVTIYADTKTEVPETASALLAALTPNEYSKNVKDGIAAGSVIWTAALDAGVVKANGSIVWN
jgi:hypothetical protein